MRNFLEAVDMEEFKLTAECLELVGRGGPKINSGASSKSAEGRRIWG